MNNKPTFILVAILISLNSHVAFGQVIDLQQGDRIADNEVIAAGTTVNVNGGEIGLGVELQSGILNVNSGSVAIGASSMATGFNNISNEVNINGGEVGGFFQLRSGTQLTLSGGILESFGVLSDSHATITGGAVLVFPDIVSGTVDIMGGDVASVRVFDGGTLNLFGTEFFIDGTPMADLEIDQAVEITQRDVVLSATLADGSFFEFELNPNIVGLLPDAATPASTVTVTRVEKVVLVGDVNGDNEVNLLDVAPFVDAITADVFVTAADINKDGSVDLLDVAPFVQLIVGE